MSAAERSWGVEEEERNKKPQTKPLSVSEPIKNRGVFYGLKNGGFSTAESDLNDLVRRVWMVCVFLGVNLQCEYVGKHAVIHAGADALSREKIEPEQRLKPEVFTELEIWCGRVDVDLFASRRSAQRGLPYYAEHPELQDPNCLGVDALAHGWSGRVYAFPPAYLAQSTIEKSLESRERCSTILVLPDWPGQPWYGLLGEFQQDSWDLGPASQALDRLDDDKRSAEEESVWSRTRLRAWFIPRRV